MEREVAISKLVERINEIQLGHPVRIGIDGVDASGKTMLANELVEPLKRLGRDVLRVSIDKFHNPQEIRYRQGRTSPQGYYEDSFDFDTIISQVLYPLGPSGDLIYNPVSFDFVTDTELVETSKQASKNSILLFEGVFLHHPRLVTYWDYTIFVHAAFETTIKRAMKRDLYLLETPEMIEKMYKTKYIPGQQIYLEAEKPQEKSDVVFVNDEVTNPELEFR